MVAIVSQADHERITAAIREAETRTSGEIFAVLARASDDYFFVCGFFAGAWVIVAGLMAAVVPGLFGIGVDLAGLLATMGLAYAGLLVLFAFVPRLRILAVPAPVARRRAEANAARQFLAHGISQTRDRTGVLLFVSLAEHHAQVLADSGIDAVVDGAVWLETVDALIDHAARGEVSEGFLEAIAICGGVLAEHFPATGEPRGELDDRLVEL